MATFVEFASEDIKTDRDLLEQVVDVLQNDISSSATRKKYQVWTSGGVGPGITSSLFQTVFDQDFTYQTANAVFDMTMGLSTLSSVVLTGSYLYTDATTGMMFFTSQSVQMREKVSIYKEMAQTLLGDASREFSFVENSTTVTVREPIFLAFKRLFHRDKIKRETFACRFYVTASGLASAGTVEKIFTDVGSSTYLDYSYGGQVSTIVDSANTSRPVGLLYIDKGIAVLDSQRVFDTGTTITGTIRGMSVGGTVPFSGGLNKLLASASIDDVIDHLASTRVANASNTAIVFQNQTSINSTIFFCTLKPDDFNYSSNPTYTDSNGRIVVIDAGQEETQRSFSFITGIGLYDADNQLLGMAKMSRPVLKSSDRLVPIKIRLDV